MTVRRRLLIALLILSAAGCARMQARERLRARQADRDTIYMSSTFRALVEGLFEGDVTCGELRRHGDVGIGTFDNLDGEMVMVDGRIYQVKADGSVNEVEDSVKTPYATVTPLDPERVIPIPQPIDFDGLRKRLDAEFPNQNLPYAFRIDGLFTYVKTRSVPAQMRPYPRLIEVIKNQPTFEFENVPGTIVGFRLPPHLESVGVPGYHFHFLTADRKAGGHLLAFGAAGVRVIGDASPSINLVLPQNETFAQTNLDRASRAEMDTIMGRKAPAKTPLK